MPKDMASLMGEEDDDEDYSASDDSEPESELMTAARSAFPDQDWDEDRLAGLKELIHLCGEKDYGEEPPSKKSGDGGLALIFGKPKK